MTSSECIGKDAAAVAIRRVDDVKEEMKKKEDGVKTSIQFADKELNLVLNKLPQVKQGISFFYSKKPVYKTLQGEKRNLEGSLPKSEYE